MPFEKAEKQAQVDIIAVDGVGRQIADGRGVKQKFPKDLRAVAVMDQIIRHNGSPLSLEKSVGSILKRLSGRGET